MDEPAVKAEQLTKVYRVYATPWDRLLEKVLRRPRHREFRALHEVGFTLPKGEGLAIIGENGAGKSTLLKLLAGIGAPTSGRMEIRGKVASILELGSGFHPEFTGRQNIALNAAMLGLSAAELARRLPGIIEWSELGDFIDQPVKVYSTGMAMRLGFSIATQIEPDVLIIDEALSVGDGYFQKKCMDRLLYFLGAGGTLLFCSHAMYYASAFCQRALWLRGGRVQALGPAAEVIREYENFLLAKSAAVDRTAEGEAAAAAPPPAGDDSTLRLPARLTAARLSGGAVAEAPRGAVPLFAPGDLWQLDVEWEAADPALAFHVGVGINRIDDLEVASFATHLDGRPPMSGRTSYRLTAVLPNLPLVKGEFTLYVFLLDEAGLHIYDQRMLRRAFAVQAQGYAFGVVRIEHRWELPPDAAAIHQPPQPAAAAAATPAIPATPATPATIGRG